VPVDEYAIAALSGELANNATARQFVHGFGCCGKSHASALTKLRDAEDWTLAQSGKHAQRIRSSAPYFLRAPRIRIEQINQTSSGLHGAVGGLLNALQKEVDPSLPAGKW
jgi:hypothetical protein